MCPHLDRSVTEALRIASGALTPLIALLAVWIAYQQYRVNRKKLQLDLYEKRYGVYRALRELLSVCLQNYNVSNAELFKFLAGTNESEFLFKDEVSKYLLEVYRKANELHSSAFQLEGNALPVGPEREKVVVQQRAVFDWLEKQLDVAKKMFAPYLDFRNIR